ncbi:hypothetical protein KDA_64640 [Dictyobacter alpinus]|uniref:Uncharacterized protein n=1 Tax=Dictyobacter alpinus TaxID=2014873 RepID=A0A402BI34_9CHLR|nr:hypothetical protein KDA_64640 [Dictyobacter alpinus]
MVWDIVLFISGAGYVVFEAMAFFRISRASNKKEDGNDTFTILAKKWYRSYFVKWNECSMGRKYLSV